MGADSEVSTSFLNAYILSILHMIFMCLNSMNMSRSILPLVSKLDLQAVSEQPAPERKLYKYICGAGLWNKSHVLY